MIVFNIYGMDPSARSNACWKVPALRTMVLDKASENIHIPFIAITETWLKPHLSDAQVNIPNYAVYRSDRRLRTRGGALLYIHHSIPVSNVERFDDKTCEAIICASPRKIIFVNMYRPPKTSKESFINMLNCVEQFIEKESSGSPEHYQIIVTGDLNFPNISWEDLNLARCLSENKESAEYFLNFASRLLLTQYVNVPTRVNNTLDLLLTNDVNLVQHVSADNTIISDHNIVNVLTSDFIPSSNTLEDMPNDEEEVNFHNLNLNMADFDKINQGLACVDWDDMMCNTSLEEIPQIFNKKVFEICKNHTPTWKSKKVVSKIHRSSRALNRRKYRLRSRISAIKEYNPNSERINILQKEVENIERQVKSSILNKIHSDEQVALQAIKEDPKAFYTYAKKFRKTKSHIKLLTKKDGSITSNYKEMANLFQDQFISVFSDSSNPDKKIPESQQSSSQFLSVECSPEDVATAIDDINAKSSCADPHISAIVLKKCKSTLIYPISLIWKKSFACGKVPKFYKEQIIAPVHKKGSKAVAENYRPISLTSHVIKVFERIIRKNLVKYLEENQLLCSNQHGFRSGKSCLSQLLSHIDSIITNGLEGLDTDVIYLDFAKAFDKVDHEILIRKLSNFGIQGPMLEWLKNFLEERFQMVHLNGFKSYWSLVKSGVPQGTVLGPILFLIYINDMNCCLATSFCSMFADDSRIEHKISGVSDTKLLQEDIINVTNWSKQNNMNLNESKFKFVSHKFHRSLLDHLPFRNEYCLYNTAAGNTLEPIDSVLDLGVTVCSDLSWTKHVGIIVSKAQQTLSWALSVFFDRSITSMMTLYKSFVRSKIEYCCPLWHSRKFTDVQMIESLQRTFTSKIVGMERLDYWQRLKKLNLLSLQRRRERFIIFHMWKIVYCKITNDLNIHFRFTDRRGITALIPSIQRTNSKAQTLYDNSFALIESRLWNFLPTHISVISCFSTFKIKVDNLLSQYPDKPPIQGYPYVHDNSLLSF